MSLAYVLFGLIAGFAAAIAAFLAGEPWYVMISAYSAVGVFTIVQAVFMPILFLDIFRRLTGTGQMTSE